MEEKEAEIKRNFQINIKSKNEVNSHLVFILALQYFLGWCWNPLVACQACIIIAGPLRPISFVSTAFVLSLLIWGSLSCSQCKAFSLCRSQAYKHKRFKQRFHQRCIWYSTLSDYDQRHVSIFWPELWRKPLICWETTEETLHRSLEATAFFHLVTDHLSPCVDFCCYTS